ncbi:MAG: protein-disulfide reductase DsbD family protein [Candidatus Krumholzibacteriia bacterium]
MNRTPIRTLARAGALAATALLAAACGGDAPQRDAPEPAPAPTSGAAAAAAAVTVGATLARPAPGTVTVAWTFDLADGWHLYWHGLNDSGYPPSVNLTLPAGWTAGPLRWPVPERYLMAGGILDHVYHRRLVLLQDLTPPGGVVPAATATIEAVVRWLACRQECVPGQAPLAVTIPAGGEGLPAQVPDLPPFPEPLPAGTALAAWRGDTLTVTVPGAAALRFFPDADSGPFADLIADGEAEGDRLDLRLRRRDDALGPVRGLLQIDRADGSRVTGPFAAPAPVDPTNPANPANPGG